MSANIWLPTITVESSDPWFKRIVSRQRAYVRVLFDLAVVASCISGETACGRPLGRMHRLEVRHNKFIDSQ